MITDLRVSQQQCWREIVPGGGRCTRCRSKWTAPYFLQTLPFTKRSRFSDPRLSLSFWISNTRSLAGSAPPPFLFASHRTWYMLKCAVVQQYLLFASSVLPCFFLCVASFFLCLWKIVDYFLCCVQKYSSYSSSTRTRSIRCLATYTPRYLVLRMCVYQHVLHVFVFSRLHTSMDGYLPGWYHMKHTSTCYCTFCRDSIWLFVAVAVLFPGPSIWQKKN